MLPNFIGCVPGRSRLSGSLIDGQLLTASYVPLPRGEIKDTLV